MAESPNTNWSEVHRRVFMAVIAFIGVFIMFAAQYIQTNFWHDLTEHFGTAIFISAGLGLTIEWWLTKQITENVFAAAMGYELPDDLREEASKYTGFRYATQNPRVNVDAPGFDWLVEFAHRTPGKSGRYSSTTLDGLLLPHVSIRVRWWPKASSTSGPGAAQTAAPTA